MFMIIINHIIKIINIIQNMNFPNLSKSNLDDSNIFKNNI